VSARLRATPEARSSSVPTTPQARLEAWFRSRQWKVQPFQRAVWLAWKQGRSGLLHAPTGSGKTLAVWGAALLHAAQRKREKSAPRLKLLWITPLRALATDTLQNLRDPLDALGLAWQVGMRTGDSGTRERRLARQGKLDALITTPESLALLLSYDDTAPMLAGLDGIIVDEWHELLGSRRGVLLELCIARLRKLAPGLRTWGLSATLGNLDEALATLVPQDPTALLVRGTTRRSLRIETLLPREGERFPWSGHLGLRQLPRVLDAILAARTTLLFTNTRAQAELWHQALQSIWPDEPTQLALHHGSIDRKLRRDAEDAVRAGTLRCVIATSSLDLGVDFAAVDQVIQIGSPKGIARLLQRAGRSGHRPGVASRLLCVPTNALELVEFAAVRDALARNRIEPRRPLRLSLDVLAQHLVTRAVGGGFTSDEALAEARSTHAFADLSATHWQALLDFVVRGGEALQHYPDYRRVEHDPDDVYRVHDRRIAFKHRLSIGTITSDGSVRVQFLRGGDLGTVEELFVARLKPGDRFLFAGRCVELVALKDMTAKVKAAKQPNATVPRWMGGRMPLSTELAATMRELLESGRRDAPEVQAVASLLDLQVQLSALPQSGALLSEVLALREGTHVFLYPFAGRLVHEGLAALIAARWGRRDPNSFSYAVNDYGLVIVAAARVAVDEALLRSLLTPDGLLEDVLASLNLAELAKRQFRDIARVAGLLPPSLPGRAARALRHLQASGSVLYDVLRQHDPGHVLLEQAERDVLDAQLDIARLREVLTALATQRIALKRPASLTPLSFPLWAERVRGALSTEDWRTRVQRVADKLEAKYK
jgi:ATP-dependent helicase Lhr and Lhr-like helicase